MLLEIHILTFYRNVIPAQEAANTTFRAVIRIGSESYRRCLYALKLQLSLGVVVVTVEGLSSWRNSWTRGEDFPGSKFQVNFSKPLLGYLRHDSWAAESLAIVVWTSRVWNSYLRNAAQAAISNPVLQVVSLLFSHKSEVTALWWSVKYIYFVHVTFSSWHGQNLFSKCLLVDCHRDCVWSSLVIEPCEISSRVIYSGQHF